MRALPGFSAPGAGIQTPGKVPFDGSRGRISNSRGALHLIRTKGKKKFPAWSVLLMVTFTAHVLLRPGEALSEDQRQDLLNHIIPGQTGIVICDRDEVKDMPDMPVGHSDIVK